MNLAFSIGMVMLLGLFYSWTSRINGMFFFGRTASEGLQKSAEGRAITRRYLLGVLLAMAASALIAAAGGQSGYREFGPLALLVEIVAVSFVFARANRQVRALVQARPDSGDAHEAVRKVALFEQPTYWIPGLAAILAPLAACVVTTCAAVVLAAHGAGWSVGWKNFGDSLDRQGDSFVLGMACGMLAASVGGLLVFRASVRLRTRMAQYTVRSWVALEWIATILLVGTLVCNRMGVAISHTLGKGMVLAAVLVALGVNVWNQSRAKRFVPPPVELGADDRWRWGLFYVDRGDPALFVQSRCGAGYTLNYGRVAAWPISAGILAYFVGVFFLLPHHH